MYVTYPRLRSEKYSLTSPTECFYSFWRTRLKSRPDDVTNGRRRAASLVAQHLADSLPRRRRRRRPAAGGEGRVPVAPPRPSRPYGRIVDVAPPGGGVAR